jgi:HNH endonuclease
MSGPTGEADQHFSDEATPRQVPEQALPEFGLHDLTWSEDQWLDLLHTLVKSGVLNWKDIAALVLGHLNPSQVGTSLASSKGFKRRYGKGHTMRIVMEWVYQQTGRCEDCGSRLELQADHIQGRESFKNPLDADFIENIILRCRRCNVVRRPSHEWGGLTYLTAEAALMWIMLVIRPRTLCDFIRLCRLYGMTMSDIRMQEAWAMAHWLARLEPPAYGIENDEASSYDLLLWPDSAITRSDVDKPLPEGASCICAGVPGSAVLGFLTLRSDGRLKFHEQPVAFIPFSTYSMGTRPAQALCIRYTPPNRKKRKPQTVIPLPPREATLVCYAVRRPNQTFRLARADQKAGQDLKPGAPPYGKLVQGRISPADARLLPIASPQR